MLDLTIEQATTLAVCLLLALELRAER